MSLNAFSLGLSATLHFPEIATKKECLCMELSIRRFHQQITTNCQAASVLTINSHSKYRCSPAITVNLQVAPMDAPFPVGSL